MNTDMRTTASLADVLAEFLSHGDNWFFILPPLAMGSLLLVFDPQPVYLLWFAFGWLVFLPQEYLTHLWILHHAPLDNPRWYRHQYRLHFGHHDLPRRLDLMYMPLWLSLPMTVVNALLFAWIADTQGQWFAALSGAFTGYVVFEWTHLLCHVPYVPRSRWFRRLRQRHLWHHYREHRLWFAVSWPCAPLDTLFGSGGTSRVLPAPERSRYLGVADSDPRLLAARDHFAHRSDGNPSCSRIWLATPTAPARAPLTRP